MTSDQSLSIHHLSLFVALFVRLYEDSQLGRLSRKIYTRLELFDGGTELDEKASDIPG